MGSRQSTASFDRDLAGALHDMQGSLDGWINRLYERRVGCSCDERGLCACHAQVAQYLQAARVQLGKAADYTLKDG